MEAFSGIDVCIVVERCVASWVPTGKALAGEKGRTGSRCI